MDFVDNSGHVFTLESYYQKPIGYEYEVRPYVFWMNGNNGMKMSVNNYYVKIINALIAVPDTNLDIANDFTLEIYIDNSQIFTLMKAEIIQDIIKDKLDIKDALKISKEDMIDKWHDSNMLSSKNEKDLIACKISSESTEYLLIPIYVIGNTSEEGTWTTNILIHYKFSDGTNTIEESWTPVTVGGVWTAELETLQINKQNYGIKIPKDILKAVYQESFRNDVFNEALWNDKVKEYLLNYMGIRGETGNYKSIIKSLKWFGYGDKISISHLLNTDNTVETQFVRDWFDSKTDILESFKAFKNSTMLSVIMPLKAETEGSNGFDFSKKQAFGEDNPELEDLLSKNVLVNATLQSPETEAFYYAKPYFDYIFLELGLKLSCLKYYFEKYFLPIHLSVHSAALQDKVFANSVKMLNASSSTTAARICDIADYDEVSFPKSHLQYFTHQLHIVDENLNEFEGFNPDIDTVYYINDTCLNIPVKFKSFNKFYSCVFILEKLEKVKDSYDKHILINKPVKYNEIDTLYIKDKFYNELQNADIDISYSFDFNNYSVYYKGIDTLKEKIKNASKAYASESTGEMSYSDGKYVLTLDGKEYEISESTIEEYRDGKYYIIPSKDNVNANIFDASKFSYIYYVIEDVYLSIRYNYDILQEIKISGKDISDHIYINRIPDSSIIFETHFNFMQSKEDLRSIYHDFVIYPKIINQPSVIYKSNQNIYDRSNASHIDFWTDQSFRLRVLCNNKWYSYEFTAKLHELNIALGKLEYKYWFDDIHVSSKFMQLSELSNDHVKFNSFMFEPLLATVNNIDFLGDLNAYLKLSNIQYISNEYIDDDAFYYFIKIGSIEIAFRHSDKGKDIIIPAKSYSYKPLSIEDTVMLFNEKGDAQSKVYILQTDNNMLYDKESENIGIMLVRGIENSTAYEDKAGSSIYKISENSLSVSENGDLAVKDALGNSSEALVFKYDKDSNSYWTIYRNVKYSFPVNEKIHDSWNEFLKKYISTYSISSDKYLNNIHIFGIYKKKLKEESLFYSSGKMLRYCGIEFSQNPYLANGTIYNDRIFISGSYSQQSSLTPNLWIDTSDENADIYVYWADPSVKEYSKFYGYYIQVDENGKECFDSEGNKVITMSPKTEIVKEGKHIGYYVFDNWEDFINSSDDIIPVNISDDSSVIYYIKYGNDTSRGIYYYIDWPSKDDPTVLGWKLSVLDDSGSKVEVNLESYNTFMENLKSSYKIRLDFYINNKKAVFNNNFEVLTAEESKIIENGGTVEKYGTVLSKGNTVETRGFFYYDESIGKYLLYDYQTLEWTEIDSDSFEHDAVIMYTEDSSSDNEIRYDKVSFNNYFKQKIKNIPGKVTVKIDSSEFLSDKIDFNVWKEDNETGETEEIEKDGDSFVIQENDNASYYVTVNLKVTDENGNVILYDDDNWISPKIIYSDDDSESYERLAYSPDNEKTIDVSIGHKDYHYGDNSSESTIALYNVFFKNKTYKNVRDDKDNPDLTVIEPAVSLGDTFLNYDFYLMHDNDYWYGIFISRETIDNAMSIDDLKISKKLDPAWYLKDASDNSESSKAKNSPLKIDDYSLVYEKTGNEFLPNRMKFVSSEGKNHFDRDDIIAGLILNNINVPVKADFGSKWTIYPLSIGVTKEATQESNAEMFIFGTSKNDIIHYKGYYNITCRYSLDRYTQQQVTKTAVIKIS